MGREYSLRWVGGMFRERGFREESGEEDGGESTAWLEEDRRCRPEEIGGLIAITEDFGT